MQKQFQNDISSVLQLTLKFVDGSDALPVFLIGDFTADVFPDKAFHPSGIQEHDLSVFRNGAGVRMNEGITALVFRNDSRRNNIVKPRVNFTDQFLDQTSLSGCSPSLQQDENRQLFLTHALQHTQKLITVFSDFTCQMFLVFRLGLFNIFQHNKLLAVCSCQFHYVYYK